MKLIMKIDKNEEGYTPKTKEIEGDKDQKIASLLKAVSSEAYKEIKYNDDIISFNFQDTNREEIEDFYNEFLEKLVKQDLLQNYEYVSFNYEPHYSILYIEKEQDGYFSANHFEQKEKKTRFAELSLFEPKTFKELVVPDHKDPKKSFENMQKYNPTGIGF